MSWPRRKLATVVTWVVVAAWVLFYAIALATGGHRPVPVTAVAQLVVPPLLWVALLQLGSASHLAARFVWRHWRSAAGSPRSATGLRRSAARSSRSATGLRRSAAGSPTSATDRPARMLAAAVAALPEHRREWGTAMLAELAEIRGRSARWQFALSCARATLWLPPAGGWPVLAVTVVVVGAVAAVGTTVGSAVPGLTVFAMTFTGLVGAMLIVAVARSRPLTLPVSAPTILVTGAVAASIAATAVFLRREPAAAQHLSPPAAVYLGVVLAGCLWIAVAPPRWLAARAPHLSAAGAVLFTTWFLLSNRLDETDPPVALLPVLGLVLVGVPAAAFFVPAYAAGRAGRSLRSGVQAAVWTVTAAMPLSYALWLPEALRSHAIDGRTLDGELVAPVGVNLPEAMIFCLGIFPVLGFTVGVVGAVIGARRNLLPAPAVGDGKT